MLAHRSNYTETNTHTNGKNVHIHNLLSINMNPIVTEFRCETNLIATSVMVKTLVF